MSFEYAPQKYNGNWPEFFHHEAENIKKVCGTAIVEVNHIGSTAIAGLMAKPIVDILISVIKGSLHNLNHPMESLGYVSKGESGIAGRSYFSKNGFHVHCFEEGHFEIEKHLAFRNYLRAHAETRDEYQALKTKILGKKGITREEYQNFKHEFITEIDKRAASWNRTVLRKS